MEKKIRVLIAKAGLDGHDRGAKVIAAAFRDAGIEVIYTGLRQTPEMIVEAALQEDVDAIGLSVMTGAHLPITEKLMARMRREEVADKLVFVGGVIPAGDVSKLEKLGVAGVFPGGTPLADTIALIKSKARKI